MQKPRRACESFVDCLSYPHPPRSMLVFPRRLPHHPKYGKYFAILRAARHSRLPEPSPRLDALGRLRAEKWRYCDCVVLQVGIDVDAADYRPLITQEFERLFMLIRSFLLARDYEGRNEPGRRQPRELKNRAVRGQSRVTSPPPCLLIDSTPNIVYSNVTPMPPQVLSSVSSPTRYNSVCRFSGLIPDSVCFSLSVLATCPRPPASPIFGNRSQSLFLSFVETFTLPPESFVSEFISRTSKPVTLDAFSLGFPPYLLADMAHNASAKLIHAPRKKEARTEKNENRKRRLSSVEVIIERNRAPTE